MAYYKMVLFIVLGTWFLALGFLFACDDDPVDQEEKDAEEAIITESEACNAYCKKIIKCQIWDWSQDECVQECAMWYNDSSTGKCYYDCLDRDCDQFYECTNACHAGGGGSGY